PGFPATEIEGEYYWNGGLVSNTPLQWMLDNRPHQDTLAFQVDLWSADGELPCNLQEAEVRQKKIKYSTRPARPPTNSSMRRRCGEQLDRSLWIFRMTGKQRPKWRCSRRKWTKKSIIL